MKKYFVKLEIEIGASTDKEANILLNQLREKINYENSVIGFDKQLFGGAFADVDYDCELLEEEDDDYDYDRDRAEDFMAIAHEDKERNY
mgnify:CR=1 FL=1